MKFLIRIVDGQLKKMNLKEFLTSNNYHSCSIHQRASSVTQLATEFCKNKNMYLF